MSTRKHKLTQRPTELGEGESRSKGEHKKIRHLCHLLGRVWPADVLCLSPRDGRDAQLVKQDT